MTGVRSRTTPVAIMRGMIGFAINMTMSDDGHDAQFDRDDDGHVDGSDARMGETKS